MIAAELERLKQFNPSREAGLLKLKRFIPLAGSTYRARRNYDLGPADRSNVSTLSPYLRNRLLSEWEVSQAILGRHSYRSAETFIQEVFWRTYWKGYLENHPDLWEQYREQLPRLGEQYKGNPDYAAALAGNTGISCFDFWIRELYETGYLHNHARMWFASIWIFTLGLPWQLGADLFFRHLLDGDPASNTLSWRWVAGLHTKGKTYLARPSNIDRYTESRFSPVENLATRATPPEPFHPAALQLVEPLLQPDEPRFATAGLLLLDEDLGGSVSRIPRSKAILALYPKSIYAAYGIADTVKTFRSHSLNDQIERLRDANLAPVERSETTTARYIIAWAKQHKLATIVLRQPQTGPWGDWWKENRPLLEAEGYQIETYREWWENELYPYATGGFFTMKKQLPRLLESTSSLRA
ncbi:FAD-binding domain-containing protein [Pelagicoccus sp. SDUM812003]|uniref:FAD-binding domain-containing protein n=1 Tax=Pelagicoccus sp. SDUM812003 TaxID=3041267 RepID=UPI00280EA2DB|nr:FAD-binding domain-containing protein [Pelagicoccus sp. SDUM812003]MDQ8202913.1 FAD-binding domain-containing protein [Pelagicoccus sp. SDUM812003]